MRNFFFKLIMSVMTYKHIGILGSWHQVEIDWQSII